MSIRPLHVSGGYNNSVWFMVQSKYLAWLFLFIPLTGVLKFKDETVRKRVLNLLVLAAFLILAVYSVKANKLLLKYYKYEPIHQPVILDSNYRNIFDSRREQCDNGDVFISDDYWVNYMLVGIGCKTVLFADWGGTFASVGEIRKRRNELKLFWEGYYLGGLDYALLEKYQVKYVISGKTFELESIDYKQLN